MMRAASERPEVLSSLLGRAVQRAQWLALQFTIADLRRVDDRLLAAFWHFADRWGTAGPDGVVVPLAVTHDVLAQLVSAQRPTVTAALQRLHDAGHVQRQADRTWLLLGGPPGSGTRAARHHSMVRCSATTSDDEDPCA